MRKQAERETRERGLTCSIVSLSPRTITYKGMLTPHQVETFYPDLVRRARHVGADRLVHSRFSTNTFPSWPLAHPYRYIAHNGEINTIRGNRNWMAAREALLETDLIPGDAAPRLPGLHARTRRTRRTSTRCSNCCTWPAAACRTPCS